ncbi:MAG TPA: ABC transporter permease [Candidatus Limnocylindria bacterium]
MTSRSRYLGRRIGWALVTILVVITFNFVLFRVLPGDPAKPGVKDPRLNPETQAALTERFGLDKPLFFNFGSGEPFDSQYFIYIGNLLRGDLGTSFASPDRSVGEMISEALVNTLWLVIPSQILSIVVGILLGLVAAWKRGKATDLGALASSLFLWSLPTFFLAIILLFIGVRFFDLPIGGKQTIGADYANVFEAAADLFAHLLLPTLTLTLVLIGEYMLIMRSSVLDVFSEDYILTAKAKGLSTSQIIRGHALKNAMLPMVTLIAINLAFTVSGAIQVEEVFSWPGLGHLTIEAVSERDYPVLQGAFLLLAVAVVVANLIADLVYGWLDPRVTEA